MDQVLVENPENLERLTGRIRSMEGVDDVQSGSEWVQRMALVKQGLMLLGLFLGAGLLVTVIFIISNTIKLMVYAREEEIEIMRLVGATESFIRAPFILEGMIQGFLGTLTAAVDPDRCVRDIAILLEQQLRGARFRHAHRVHPLDLGGRPGGRRPCHGRARKLLRPDSIFE